MMSELRERLTRLAKWQATGTPVITVYLNTRWHDEQQRERVRIFLKNELRRAREAGRARPEDLEWVEAQGHALIERTMWPDADGVALFACRSAGLAERVPMRVPFDDAFVVNDAPYLPPLASAADETPAALVVFVDGTSARLIPITATGPGDELTLASPVEGRHRTGGWAALAQSRYQRHVQQHREQHFGGVAASIVAWSERQGAEHVVLAGEPRALAGVREHLPERVRAKIVGVVSGARYEPTAALVARAEALIRRAAQSREGDQLEAALTEAAKGGQAVDGVERTLEAVNRGAVWQLFVLRDFRDVGHACETCGALQRGLAGRCAYCARETRPVLLDEAIIDRVIAGGGSVTVVDRHATLARHGGLLARLRYAA